MSKPVEPNFEPADDGIDDWLRKYCPEAFFIARRRIAPKRKDQLRYIAQLQRLEKRMDTLEGVLKKEESKVQACRAKLRFWEREEPVFIPISIKISKFSFYACIPLPSFTFLNNVFDWLIKVGLSVVPFLALLSIVGAKLTIFNVEVAGAKQDGQGSPSQIILFFVIFSALSLTWMVSAYICNWILSQPEEEQKEKGEKEKGEGEKEKGEKEKLIGGWQIFIFFLIWLSEAFVGVATIPALLGNTRLLIDGTVKTGAKWQDYIEWYEYLEIAIGIGLFAFINILSSIAKARRYRFNTKNKVELGKAIAERNYTKERLNRLRKEIANLEAKIAALDQEIKNPDFNTENVFNRSISELSMLYMKGIDVQGIDSPNSNSDSNNKGD